MVNYNPQTPNKTIPKFRDSAHDKKWAQYEGLEEIATLKNRGCLTMDSNKHARIEDAKVLLVEDSEINIKVMDYYIRTCGIHSLDVARSGEEALNLFSSKYNLIFLDVNLPGISGIEVCREIRKKAIGKSVPIVAYTTESNSIKEGIAAGINEYLIKPTEFKEVQEMIQRYLG